MTRELAAAAPATYRYPTPPDELVLDRTAESRLLLEALDPLAPAPRPARAIALDAGCGFGRYLGALRDRFTHVLGTDADAARLEVARRSFPDVALYPVPLDAPLLDRELFGGAMRAIVCMQVLGHLPRAAAARLLSTFAHLLEPEGRLVLAVPYTNQRFDDDTLYVAAERKDRPIPAARFDALAAAPRAGELPVRHYAMLTLEAMLDRAGLAPESMQPYAWYSYTQADLLVVARRR